MSATHLHLVLRLRIHGTVIPLFCIPSCRAEGRNLKSRAIKSSLLHFCVCSTNKIYEIYIGDTKNGIYGLGEADGRDFHIRRRFLFLLGTERLNSVPK
jgi:hypothetical protein